MEQGCQSRYTWIRIPWLVIIGKELAEVFLANGLLLDGSVILNDSEEFLLDSALGEVIPLLLVLEHIAAVLFELLLGDVGEAVLHELCACGLLGEVEDILELDLDFESLSDMVLDDLPLEVVDELGELVGQDIGSKLVVVLIHYGSALLE